MPHPLLASMGTRNIWCTDIHESKTHTYKMTVILKNVSFIVNEDAYLPLQLSEALDGFYV